MTIPSLGRMYTWTPKWNEPTDGSERRGRSSSEKPRPVRLQSMDDTITTRHARRTLHAARSSRRTQSGFLLGWRAVPHNDSHKNKPLHTRPQTVNGARATPPQCLAGDERRQAYPTAGMSIPNYRESRNTHKVKRDAEASEHCPEAPGQDGFNSRWRCNALPNRKLNVSMIGCKTSV